MNISRFLFEGGRGERSQGRESALGEGTHLPLENSPRVESDGHSNCANPSEFSVILQENGVKYVVPNS